MNLEKTSYYSRIGFYAAISIIVINVYFLVYNNKYLKSQEIIIMAKKDKDIKSG